MVVGDDLQGTRPQWGYRGREATNTWLRADVGGRGPGCLALTWRVVGIMRFRPSMEMLTAMLMPAKRRLLFPRMEKRALLGAWWGTGA